MQKKVIFTKRCYKELPRHRRWKKLFYEQPFDSYIKRYQGIKMLTTGQGEDSTESGLFDYECIKNHY